MLEDLNPFLSSLLFLYALMLDLAIFGIRFIFTIMIFGLAIFCLFIGASSFKKYVVYNPQLKLY